MLNIFRVKEKYGVQLLLRMSIVIGVTTASFIAAFILYQDRIFKTGLMEEGKALTQLAAGNLRLAVFSDNRGMIESVAADMFHYKGMEGITVYAGEGKLLRGLAKNKGKIVEGSATEAKAQWDAVQGCAAQNNSVCQFADGQYLFYSPVLPSGRPQGSLGLFVNIAEKENDRAIGFVIMRFNYKKELEGQHSLIIYSGIWLAGAILAVAFIIAVPLVRQVVRPIQQLTNAVTEIGARGISDDIPSLSVNRRDEIGKLTEAFNSMWAALHKKEVERKQYESELAQAQKMESIGILSGGLAHDFNNLLTGIMSRAADIAKEAEEGSQLAHYISQIQGCADHAAGITRNLLTYSNKAIVDCAVVDVNELASDMSVLLRVLIPENIIMTMEQSKEKCLIEGDKAQIQQCILNLAVNARDAMPGGGRLAIRIEHVNYGEEGKRHVALSVEDTGVGMDEDTRKRIFEPFFTTKALGQGTGLGLAIVYGISRTYGGGIDVQSRVGEGTTFTVYFPLLEEEGPQKGNIVPGGLAGSETVLLAEDNRFVREIVADVMRRWGYGVITAVDGEDAISQFASHQTEIDIVVCDVIMPGRSGIEVRNTIKSCAPNIPFLFMSGYTSAEGSPTDCDAFFIAKPVTADTVIAKIREIIDRRRV